MNANERSYDRLKVQKSVPVGDTNEKALIKVKELSELKLMAEHTRGDDTATDQTRNDSSARNSLTLEGEFPLTVKDAAKYLGVSAQTVYLWVEQKQIPHLRVMGRNIRFLKSDLEPFRASFKQEMRNG
jgi:excisionase family DNA binding protein